MAFAIENLRLQELAIVAEQNRNIYEDFVGYLRQNGYDSLYDFVLSKDQNIAQKTLEGYLLRSLPNGIALYDGIARPYPPNKAKWFLISWIFRDAPAQRLGPMLTSIEGRTLSQRQSRILNAIRIHVATIFPDPNRWEWDVIAEVVIDRLEGSRRAIKGTLFEAIVREMLSDIFLKAKIPLKVGEIELRLEGETYDVSIVGPKGTLLIPVKTRETMGGGHALLFTRDIHKSITAASSAGYRCLPIIIAESWAADLKSLNCDDFILVSMNPNQLLDLKPVLYRELRERVPLYLSLI